MPKYRSPSEYHALPTEQPELELGERGRRGSRVLGMPHHRFESPAEERGTEAATVVRSQDSRDPEGPFSKAASSKA